MTNPVSGVQRTARPTECTYFGRARHSVRAAVVSSLQRLPHLLQLCQIVSRIDVAGVDP
jgi:hypothetical protein